MIYLLTNVLNPVLQHSLTTKARGDVHANKCCYNLGCPVGRYLFFSVIPASGTRQIDKTFIKGLLTILKTHNKRKLRQQYRKSRLSGDKTAPLAVSFHHA